MLKQVCNVKYVVFIYELVRFLWLGGLQFILFLGHDKEGSLFPGAPSTIEMRRKSRNHVVFESALPFFLSALSRSAPRLMGKLWVGLPFLQVVGPLGLEATTYWS